MRSYTVKFNIEDLTIKAFLHISHGAKPTQVLHFHSTYEIQYVYSGECLVEIERNRCELSEGSILVIAPKIFHQVANKEQSFDRLSIALSLERNKSDGSTYEYYRDVFLRADGFLRLPNELPELRALTERLLRAKSPLRADEEQLLCAYFTATFIKLAEALMENHRKEDGEEERERESLPDRELSGDIIGFITDGYDRDLTVGELAARLGFSVRQVERIIQSNMGTTFSRLLNEYRIRIARRMILQEPDRTLEEIGYAVGYRDYHCFLKQFKRYEKNTPSAYRRALREEQSGE